jgi:SARP family transcriptional regulator, regulator of embCAB operon
MILAIECPSSLLPSPTGCHNVRVTASPALRIQLCGPLVIERAGQRLDRDLPGRQGQLLFAYLTCNRHRPVRRAELIEALWPEPPPAADSALNALVSKLRRVLGGDTIEGRSVLQVRLGNALVDIESAVEAVHRAESAVAVGDWTRAWGPSLVALFTAQREFLPDHDAPWIDQERARLAEVHLRALETYATCCIGIGGTELVAGVRAGRDLVRLAPLRESGHQLLMRALAAQGNVAEALRVYTELCAILRDQLGVPPCAATRAVHDQLLTA